jgi:hypothetical protein
MNDIYHKKMKFTSTLKESALRIQKRLSYLGRAQVDYCWKSWKGTALILDSSEADLA